MLLLTRLNGHPMAINGDLIKSVESSPDTMITLITGEKIVVLESLDLVIEAARLWRVNLLRSTLAEPSEAERAQQAASMVSATAAATARKLDPHSETERNK